MFFGNAIGHIGGDAEVKTSNGKEFVSFRIAHTDRWTDDAGNAHEETLWIDCVMNGKPNVFDWLKKGQMVFVSGSVRTRVYSSAKDRCMKAGVQINVRTLELLGGRSDEIPSVLFDATNGQQVDVLKFYNVPSLVRAEDGAEWYPLVSRNQDRFICDRNGWVQKFVEEAQQ